MEDYIGIFHTEKDKFILEEKIGDGLTSIVYLCRNDHNSKEKYALKLFNSNCFYSQEVNALMKCKHPNIIKMISNGNGTIERGCNYDAFELSSTFRHLDRVNYIMFEYLPNGELFDYIAKAKQGFSEGIARKLFKTIVDVLDYCFNVANICHCDIKLENILLAEDNTLKLIDFGFARDCNISPILYDWNGTHGYSSPQVYSAKKGYNGVANDMFSLGVLLFIMCIGRIPFDTPRTTDSNYKWIIRGDYASFWRRFEGMNSNLISDELKDLIQKLFAFDEKKRMTMEELKEHKWWNLGNITTTSWGIKKNVIDEGAMCIVNNNDDEDELFSKEFIYRKFLIDTYKTTNKRKA